MDFCTQERWQLKMEVVRKTNKIWKVKEKKRVGLKGLWRQEVTGKWKWGTLIEKRHIWMRVWLIHSLTYTHADWVSSRAVECKQVSYGRECTISRSFPSPLQQALLYHTSAVSTASEDYREREKGKRERERLSRRVGKESRVWNWNLHSPYVPSKLWLLPGRHFFPSDPYSSWENITGT